MYAIIETGGKQYRVAPGDVVSFERLEGNVGQAVKFDKVLLIGGKADQQVLVGTPYVDKASLGAEIVEQTRGEKLLTIKYKRRKGYRRSIGHRQELTRVLITAIDDGRGQSLKFDTAKRTETLIKASVPFSTRKADRAAKFAGGKKAGSASKEAKTATKKAAPKKTAKKA